MHEIFTERVTEVSILELARRAEAGAYLTQNSALYASCAAVHSASTKLLNRALAEGTARADLTGDESFALVMALDGQSTNPRSPPWPIFRTKFFQCDSQKLSTLEEWRRATCQGFKENTSER